MPTHAEALERFHAAVDRAHRQYRRSLALHLHGGVAAGHLIAEVARAVRDFESPLPFPPADGYARMILGVDRCEEQVCVHLVPYVLPCADCAAANPPCEDVLASVKP